MIRFAVCDDEMLELTRAENLLKRYAGEHPHFQIAVHLFSTPIELLAHVDQKGSFDILLLDVYMPGFLGTETARELRNMGDNCQLIFLTTSRDHAVDAFSLNAAHYLIKPYIDKDFFTALDKAIDNLSKKDAAYITIKSPEGIRRIALNKFVYAEANNHFQRIHLSDGTTINTRKTATELFELLDEDPRFNKCSSAYIINMDYITQVSPQGVVLTTGEKIPVPSRKYVEFKKLYMDYCCKD